MDELQSIADLERVLADSQGPLLIYKHSTQCGLCDGAIAEIEAFQQKDPAAAKVYYLDLLAHRDVSDAIAKRLGVKHESPQAIFLKGGKVVAVLNHRSISADALSVTVSATQKR